MSTFLIVITLVSAFIGWLSANSLFRHFEDPPFQDFFLWVLYGVVGVGAIAVLTNSVTIVILCAGLGGYMSALLYASASRLEREIDILDEVDRRVLAETPPEPILEPPPPKPDLGFLLPDDLRTSHMMVVGSTGSGKTQCLQSFIAADIEEACTVIVMDSQGDMINNILKLDIDRERIVHIDPSDVEFPLALSLFDIGSERINTYSRLERETQTNGIIELLTFTLESLLGAELTAKQNVAFRYVCRLLVVIPNANIHTMRELFSPNGFAPYAQYTSQLSESGQAFFRHEFNSKAFEETKQQVVRRIYGILENETMARMFSATKSKLDMFKEMQEGNKVILINTSKSLLKKDGSQLFGRFMISLIGSAILERATVPEIERVRTYFYIDEAAEYFNGTVTSLLETSRKYNCGLILAFQSLGQIPVDLKHSFITNTAIKLIGGVSGADARALADDVHAKPEQLLGTQKLHFYTYWKGRPRDRERMRIIAGRMEDLPRRDDMKELRAMTREKYSVPIAHFDKKIVEVDDLESLNKA